MTDRPALFHLALADEWAAAQRTLTYERSTIGRSLAEEGFIHLAFRDQVRGVAERFYAGVPDTVLLHIDPDGLDAEVRVEDLFDAGEAFPHLYGALPVAAVTRAVEVELGADRIPDVDAARES